MDDDRRALITHLMAEITARLEAAHELSAMGQAGPDTGEGYVAIWEGIKAAVGDVLALAEAAQVLGKDHEQDEPTDDGGAGAE